MGWVGFGGRRSGTERVWMELHLANIKINLENKTPNKTTALLDNVPNKKSINTVVEDINLFYITTIIYTS